MPCVTVFNAGKLLSGITGWWKRQWVLFGMSYELLHHVVAGLLWRLPPRCEKRQRGHMLLHPPYKGAGAAAMHVMRGGAVLCSVTAASLRHRPFKGWLDVVLPESASLCSGGSGVCYCGSNSEWSGTEKLQHGAYSLHGGHTWHVGCF